MLYLCKYYDVGSDVEDLWNSNRGWVFYSSIIIRV